MTRVNGARAQGLSSALEFSSAPPPPAALKLGGSVGLRKKNDPADVQQIAKALYTLGYLNQADTTDLGVISKGLAEFKIHRCHVQHPPGTVDAGSRTEQLLRQDLAQINKAPAVAERELQNLQSELHTLVYKEYKQGVRSHGGKQRGPEIEGYLKGAGMYDPQHPAKPWCGALVGSRARMLGFERPVQLGGTQYLAGLMLYSCNTALGLAHERAGNSRQFFGLTGSAGFERFRTTGKVAPGDTLEHATRPLLSELQQRCQGHAFDTLPIRPGDVVYFSKGHIGTVHGYDPHTGTLQVIEGNTTANIRTRDITTAKGQVYPKTLAFKARTHAQVARGEGDTVRMVALKSYDLSDPRVRDQLAGFYRPSRFDFRH